MTLTESIFVGWFFTFSLGGVIFAVRFFAESCRGMWDDDNDF